MIKLVRVDHRLLHGQVIFSWTKQLSANYIIVADDKVPNDPISMMALSIAKPADCELSIIPFSKVKEVVEKNADKNRLNRYIGDMLIYSTLMMSI